MKYLLGKGKSLLPLFLFPALASQAQRSTTLPNVIYIMTDDLGIGDLGCYGQKQIKTPAIDKLSENGMRFAQHYSGSTVSAPSRCSLLTGKHTGNSYIRGNKEYANSDGETYDYPLKDDEITIGEIFKSKDYKTACIGKWGLGGPDSEGHPNKQGFDYFFGYLGQLNAHKYYPHFLWENNTKVNLNEKVYSPYILLEKTLEFIDKNRNEPFFLYLTPTLPHAELLVPDEELDPFKDSFFETPYIGNHYASQPKPRAAHAAMVTRIDKDVQKIVQSLEEKGILDNTIIIFTSDNGIHAEGGHNMDYFDSNGPFRGGKRDLYEGGIRTPFIVQWLGVIKKGSVSYHISAFWDFLPTICELLNISKPANTDGISYLPELTGKREQFKHDYLYWEFHEQGGKQAVLKDNWKLIRLNALRPDQTKLELYNISADPSEQLNAISQYSDKAKELEKLMDNSRTHSEVFPFKGK